MIVIQEKEKCVQIENDNSIKCYPRGTVRPVFTNGSLTVFDGPQEHSNSKSPLFSVNKVANITSVTDKDGVVVTLTTVEQLAKDIAKFFV
jgi:hypothetical protein